MNADFAPLHGESFGKISLWSNSAVSDQTGSVFVRSQWRCCHDHMQDDVMGSDGLVLPSVD